MVKANHALSNSALIFCRKLVLSFHNRAFVGWSGLRSSLPKVVSPETRVMSPEIYSHVARNFIMLKNILKLLVRVKCETVKLRLFVSLSSSWRASAKLKKAKLVHGLSESMLEGVAYMKFYSQRSPPSSQRFLLEVRDIFYDGSFEVFWRWRVAWSNFISALDTGIKAHCIVILRTRNDLVFQVADYLGMRLLLLIYPLYIWLTGSKSTCDRLRKQGTTEQVTIIYAVSDPKGNDANTLCSRG